MPGPLQHGDRNRLVGAGTDGLQHARMPEGCDIAALLQVEADRIDTAGGIDRENKRKINAVLRDGRRYARHEQHCAGKGIRK